MEARSVCGSHPSHAPFLHSTCHGGRGWSKCTVTENQNTTAIVTQQTQSGETKTKHQVSLFYLSSSVCNSSHLAHNVGITPIPCFFALLFPTLRASQFRLLKPRVVLALFGSLLASITCSPLLWRLFGAYLFFALIFLSNLSSRCNWTQRNLTFERGQ